MDMRSTLFSPVGFHGKPQTGKCHVTTALRSRLQLGVCKRTTGYLRMADADGKMRIEICGWKKKNADSKKIKKKKNEKCG